MTCKGFNSICPNCFMRKVCDMESPHRKACSYFKDKSKIIELPYKIGDTVYHISKNGGLYGSGYYKNTIYEAKVVRIKLVDIGMAIVINIKNQEIGSMDIPIYCDDDENLLFGTREEAEKALKERDNG